MLTWIGKARDFAKHLQPLGGLVGREVNCHWSCFCVSCASTIFGTLSLGPEHRHFSNHGVKIDNLKCFYRSRAGAKHRAACHLPKVCRQAGGQGGRGGTACCHDPTCNSSKGRLALQSLHTWVRRNLALATLRQGQNAPSSPQRFCTQVSHV